MKTFNVTILGCGSALPTTRHIGASQVVNIHDKLFMVDCSEGTQIQFRKNKLTFSRLNHVFLSHLHGDHCFGLMGLLSTLALYGRTSDIHVWGPTDTERIFRPQIDYFCAKSPFNIIIHEVDTSQYSLLHEDRTVEIYSLPLKHRIECCGYLFKEKPGLPHIRRDMLDAYNIPISQINNIKAGADYTTEDGEIIPNEKLTTPADPARMYAYCSDTAYLPSLAHYLQGIDLLYHEATFAENNKARAAETFHSTAKQAATIAKDSHAKRLCIGHFSSRYKDEGILLEEARTIFPDTILANENLTITV